jgi:hypothetical protein
MAGLDPAIRCSTGPAHLIYHLPIGRYGFSDRARASMKPGAISLRIDSLMADGAM